MDYPVHGVSWTLLSILSFLTFSQCLNDGTPDVRDAAFSALAAIAKLVGMRPLERSLEKLDDVRRKKLSEMISGSEGGTSTNTSSAVQASGATASSHEASKKPWIQLLQFFKYCLVSVSNILTSTCQNENLRAFIKFGEDCILFWGVNDHSENGVEKKLLGYFCSTPFRICS
ncbi:uncharacterized protein LOC133818376 isoform X2 [Humulus lupulus]|uniref:uncharacterized protein LOC133818376 isoform X2 n=1 Tax=Humulus lupulus TaxID=3486 RepID=UPI002B4033BE|nr:uncharacterized protein LOC133818376 isoform X2 [Humulus lupulus]